MNPFDENLDIELYVSKGYDLNVINPETGKSFIEHHLDLLTYSYNPKLKDDLVDVLSNPLLTTDTLNLKIQLLNLIHYFVDSAFDDEKSIQKFVNIYEIEDFNFHMYQIKRKTFFLRFDLNYCDLENKNLLHLAIYHSNTGSKFFEGLKELHPQFNDALKQVSIDGETLWHVFLSPYMTSTNYYDVISNLNYLNKHFPEGKYIKRNGLTPLEYISYEQKNYIPENKQDYRLKKLSTYQNIINDFIINEKIAKTFHLNI